MKSNFYSIGICLVIATLIFGCAKEYEVVQPTLKISVSKNTFKVGDTITFDFDGNADFISFYSGEMKNDFAFAKTERVYESENLLSFRMAKYAGVNENCAELKYSKDYTGEETIAAIEAATWTSLNDQFTIPLIIGTSANFTNSGDLDIANLFESDDKPIYFCWFFNTPNNTQRTQCQIAEFKIQGVVTSNPALSGILYDFADMGFKMLLNDAFQYDNYTLPNVNGTRILWTGIFNNPSDKFGWAVTKPIFRKSMVNLGLDNPISVKIVSDPESASYRYVYTEPGTYMATFVVANSSVYGRQELVKQIEITIEP